MLSYISFIIFYAHVCVYCIAHVFIGTFVIFVTLMHGANDANADVLYVDMYRDKHPGDWHGTLCLLRGHLYWLRCCRAWSHNLLQWLGVHLPRERQYNNTTPSFWKIYCMEQLTPTQPKTLPGQDSPKGARLEEHLKRSGRGRNCGNVWLECRWVARWLFLRLLIHRLARVVNP